MKHIPDNKTVCTQCNTFNICKDRGAFTGCKLKPKKHYDKD